MTSFTNSGCEAMGRSLEDGVTPPPTLDMEEMYETTRCVQWIQAGGYRKVGLQFPDELLGEAAGVCQTITLQLGFNVFILGDTTYGSCCVDEVAAEHIGADAVIHFGRTCLSPSRRLPVLYIFTRIKVNIPAVVSSLDAAIEDRTKGLILVYDTRCHYAADEMVENIKKNFPYLLVTTLLLDDGCNSNVGSSQQIVTNRETSCENKNNCHNSASPPHSECKNDCQNNDSTKESAQDFTGRLTFNGRTVCLPSLSNIRDFNFIYLGTRGPPLNSLLMRFSEKTFYCVDPKDGSLEVTSGVRTVMSRGAKLEKAKDAEIIGILVGTLGVANYQNVISRMKTIIKAAGKRSYTFVVGKPNEAKLANISEVEVFVYVACPETTIIERNTDPVLYSKLITPWELEVALLSGQEWNLAFETDFRQLLPGGSRYIEATSEPREEEASVSLLTNKTQTLGVRGDVEVALDSSTGAVVLQDGRTIAAIHVGGGGEALKGRTWQGLDPSLPSVVPVNSVIEGRSGIASGYEDEKFTEL
ncbi:2-(3-amino-3-carboxypropyl)histidine synthase subunit 2-like [Homarus americanus]|uniref:2-(3-amino-3-carboxypropyl)histidine synthase subunit 2 n=1 Tax=Homarus americanus TaxID=6706 RepID=A0A8J5JRK3_HOMAM|nr:2-(3-amino-3-carboxypropyl)histidine synthase subunit 2-like [Homarus americanus]KAG7162947.1 2-(3-amino-3-carboxypropyl)histidine synthase subunit 2-like [Homarus americanus]